MMMKERGVVVAVSCNPSHAVSKQNRDSIRLLPGLGVEGDAHMGKTMQHRSRLVRTPGAPNLRQVHLLESELHDELRASGFEVDPGRMGENVTTTDVDLLGLPTGARLLLGESAVIEVTGLRNPCPQLDEIHPGLMAATLGRDGTGEVVRKAGVMGTVLAGGEVQPGDAIRVELPEGHPEPLVPV